jgi:hypothetical protein
MAELSRRRPPSPSAEQCAQEARSHLVPAAPKSTQRSRYDSPTSPTPRCHPRSGGSRARTSGSRASACAPSA